ncbi:MAG: LacI family DNA-binding transcriptional regulator [Oscillospiraceae bacterium]|nr:LacI family DNA-binding transcriptional regulator [Oscillospiraceae bacterium]
MVTIKMIAKECGYSAATVSKALNDAPDISADTRERIRKVAESMGYTSNSAARQLKTGRSYSFGVLFEHESDKGLTHFFFSHILQGFKWRAEELGYDILFISDRLGGRELSYVEHARYRRCDGVVIACVDYMESAVTDLVRSGIPVITIDRIFDSCGSVASDNVQGISDLVHYVHAMGHRKIAFIHGEETVVTRNRIASFFKTCKELDLEIPDSYLLKSGFANPDRAGQCTRQLLELPDPPTCIFYPDDISYIGGLNEIKKMHLSIPDDISAVGYDGTGISQMLRPKLTTMKQDAEAMGILAAEELAKAVEEGRSYIPGRIVVPGILLTGETVKKLG